MHKHAHVLGCEYLKHQYVLVVLYYCPKYAARSFTFDIALCHALWRAHKLQHNFGIQL
jgi:hypothetical protein